MLGLVDVRNKTRNVLVVHSPHEEKHYVIMDAPLPSLFNSKSLEGESLEGLLLPPLLVITNHGLKNAILSPLKQP